MKFQTKKGKEYEAPAPLAPLADTHTHLFLSSSRGAVELIAQAERAGVRLLGVPVDPTASKIEEDLSSAGLDQLMRSWKDALPQSQTLQKTVFVYGVHPYGADALDASVLARIKRALKNPLVKAVGEIGLDYTCDIAPASQKKAFEVQLRLAHEYDLPVELHIRDAKDDETYEAHRDALEILETVGVPLRGADLHCFTGDVAMMEPFVEAGFFVAFGGAATFKKDEAIREAAVACPASRILTETDSPYMTPVPLRGEECEPAMVAFTAACLAEVREEAGEATKQETYQSLWENANKFFGFSA